MFYTHTQGPRTTTIGHQWGNEAVASRLFPIVIIRRFLLGFSMRVATYNMDFILLLKKTWLQWWMLSGEKKERKYSKDSQHRAMNNSSKRQHRGTEALRRLLWGRDAVQHWNSISLLDSTALTWFQRHQVLANTFELCLNSKSREMTSNHLVLWAATIEATWNAASYTATTRDRKALPHRRCWPRLATNTPSSLLDGALSYELNWMFDFFTPLLPFNRYGSLQHEAKEQREQQLYMHEWNS